MKCNICGKEFHVIKSQLRTRKCCSRGCANKWKSLTTKGIPKSEEHKQKISEAHKGRKRGPFSKKWRENLSKSLRGRKFSEIHKKRIGDAHRGSKSVLWKGGEDKTNKYKFIKCPDHPGANSSGFVREHVIVMENYLGRRMKKGEIVHHINGIKSDNRIENLEVFQSISDHMRHHYHKK